MQIYLRKVAVNWSASFWSWQGQWFGSDQSVTIYGIAPYKSGVDCNGTVLHCSQIWKINFSLSDTNGSEFLSNVSSCTTELISMGLERCFLQYKFSPLNIHGPDEMWQRDLMESNLLDPRRQISLELEMTLETFYWKLSYHCLTLRYSIFIGIIWYQLVDMNWVAVANTQVNREWKFN